MNPPHHATTEEQMTGKMLKALILGAVALSALAGAASASATTWASNGSAAGTSFTANAPASKFAISGVTSSFVCTTTSASGKLYGPSGPLTARVASLTLRFSGCVAGGITETYSCTTDGTELYAVSYAAPILTGELRAAASPICTVTIPSISGCTVTYAATNGIGTTWGNVTYDNTRGTLKLSTVGQQLTARWSSCGTLFGSASGSAAATLGSNATPPGDLTYTATAAFVPNITI
jgi:hypothetical protein